MLDGSRGSWFTDEEMIQLGPTVSSLGFLGRVPGRRMSEQEANQLASIILEFFFDAWEKGTLPNEVLQTSDEAPASPPTPE